MPETEINLTPRLIARTLLVPVTILSLITVPMTLAEQYLRPISWTLADIARRFTLNSENSVPAWFSAIMLFCAAALLAVCACMYRSREDRWWKHWTALSGLFFLLSMDEGASFHEILMTPMDALVKVEGVLYFSWVIPGGIFVAVVGFAFLGFVRHLDAKARFRFVAAGILFVGGALGMELVGGAVLDSMGEDHISYIFATMVEESCEMFGVLLFIWAIASHLADNAGHIRVTLKPRQALGSANSRSEKNYDREAVAETSRSQAP